MTPERLWSALGEIEVEVVEEFNDPPGEFTYGEFDPAKRSVKVLATLCDDAAKVTCYHEMVHAWLWDSGISRALDANAEEAICQMIATGIVAARKAGLL